jgi:RND family efflux transporter MFP subunit
MAEEKSPTSLSALRIDRSMVAPTRKRRRWGLWLLALLIAGAAAAYALVPRPVEVQAVSVVTSYPSQQFAELTASGYVVAQRRAAVASKATGRLVWLGVREGSAVKKDEVIARIDSADVVAQVAAAKAAIGQAQATIEQARVELANASVELERTRQLVARGFVSPQAVDTAKARVDRAAATLHSAQAGLAQSRAQLRVQEVAQDSTDIRAPFDGVVLVKNANVGDMITPFSQAANSQGAVVTMADLTTLEVEADVSESNVARVRLDQPVEITLDAIPDTRLRGSVGRIVPTVDRAKATVVTKIRFESLDARILPEMSAKVTFLSRPVGDADQKPILAVSPRAIVERDGRKAVLRIVDAGEAAQVQAVPVTVGRTLGELVEIAGEAASGAGKAGETKSADAKAGDPKPGALKAGDRLVASPPATLAAGAQVRVVGK